MSRIAVTGSGGYVGSALCRAIEAAGGEVVRLTRRPDGIAGAVRFALGEPLRAGDVRALRVDALIHAAYDFSLGDWESIRRVNVEGALRLCDAAREAGVGRVIAVSTLSAFEGCRSMYGKAKLAIDRAVLAGGGIVVRPGLVWGERPGGMMGRLTAAAARGGALPVIAHGAARLYLVHEEDLARLLLGLATGPWPPACSTYVAAGRRGRTLAEIVRILGARAGRRVLTVPVPWQLAWCLLRGAEALGLKSSFRSDSVLGLARANPEAAREDLRGGFPFREFE